MLVVVCTGIVHQRSVKSQLVVMGSVCKTVQQGESIISGILDDKVLYEVIIVVKAYKLGKGEKE